MLSTTHRSSQLNRSNSATSRVNAKVSFPFAFISSILSKQCAAFRQLIHIFKSFAVYEVNSIREKVWPEWNSFDSITRLNVNHNKEIPRRARIKMLGFVLDKFELFLS